MEDKINEYLSSDDLEMVKLGAILVEKYIPREEWSSFLCKYSCYVAYFTGDDDSSISTTHVKWNYNISHNKIVITDAYTTYTWEVPVHAYDYSTIAERYGYIHDAPKNTAHKAFKVKLKTNIKHK